MEFHFNPQFSLNFNNFKASFKTLVWNPHSKHFDFFKTMFVSISLLYLMQILDQFWLI